MKEREAGELEEEWWLMKVSFVGYASDVWKEVCWRMYEGAVTEGMKGENEGGREKEGI